MGKSKDKELYERLRNRGVRKRVAKDVAGGVTNGSRPAAVKRAADDLASAADEIRARMGDGAAKRSLAAQKAVRTRKRKSAKRSATARKAAKAGARS